MCFSVHRASNFLFEVVCQNLVLASASSPSRGAAEIRIESGGFSSVSSALFALRES